LQRQEALAPRRPPAGPPLPRATARLRASLRGSLSSGLSLLVLVVVWQLLVASGKYNPLLFPSLKKVVLSMWGQALSGVLWKHVGFTLYRLGTGFAIAVAIGIVLGMLMGRIWALERTIVPLVTVLMPIPALAWAPLFILWFGLGDHTAIILVAFTSTLPILLNTWTGVKTVPELWVRAAMTMGCEGGQLFLRVILPAALPYMLTGVRIGLATAWRAVVAGEMLGTTNFGLGRSIFMSREFLRSDVMIGDLLIIGVLGLLMEYAFFNLLERRTAERWGMARSR